MSHADGNQSEPIVVDKGIFDLFPGLSKQEIIDRAVHIRKIAAEKEPPHRCIEGLFFLKESFYNNNFNDEAFPKEKLSQLRIFEVGPCFGVALRKLVSNGAALHNVFGVDASETFVRLGYEFFDDKATFGDRIRVLNVLDDNFFKIVGDWCGTQPFDVVLANLVFHCLPDDNDVLAERCYQLLKPGGVLIGKTAALTGDSEATYIFGKNCPNAILHTETSFEKLLKSHGFQTVKLSSQTSTMGQEDIQWMCRNFNFHLDEQRAPMLLNFLAIK
eukprot:jgi/Galph1/1636/GphlegSOOS_G321.1